jgi:hypothetical protein
MYTIYNGSTATHRHTFLSLAIALIVIITAIIIIIINIVCLEQTPLVIDQRQMELMTQSMCNFDAFPQV